MGTYVKKDGIWQLDTPALIQPPTIEPMPTLLLPRPTSPATAYYAEVRKLPPGNHSVPGAMIFVPPRGTALRVLQFQRKGPGPRQAVYFSLGKPLIRPLKPASMLGRKERRTEVTMDLGSVLPVDAIITPLDGSPLRITSHDQLLRPVKTLGENYYTRTKKRKVLNRWIQTDELPHWNVDSLLRQFSNVYAIDTNTFQHSRGQRLSVSSVIKATLRTVERSHSILDATHYWTFLRFNVDDNPEPSAWVLLLERFLFSPDEYPSGNTAIVIDSELRSLEAYSLRRLPLYREVYLPATFSLLYAYDTLGGDQFFVNRLMAMAHTASMSALRQLRSRTLTEIKANARERTFNPNA